VRRLGLDLGATDLKLALLEDERLVSTATAPTRSEDGGPAGVLARLVELGRTAGEVESVGLAVPGIVDPRGRALLLPNLKGDWEGIELAAPLAPAFGLPIALLNDGHAFTLAEATVGAARGAQDVIGIVCGTGVGGGVVLGGELRLGIDERAGEIGHHTVLPDGERCGCGNHGCLETVASSRAIARQAGSESFTEALAAARAGDEAAVAAFARAASFLGIAIANLTLFLTPERVVVGGGVAEAAGDLLFPALRAEVTRRAGAVAPLQRVEIVPAVLGVFAGAVGAALHGARSGP
jgi:glucokinase